VFVNHESHLRDAQSFVDGGHSLPWAFDSSHCDWQDHMREFARTSVEPGAARRALTHEFDPGLCREAANLNIFGVLAPGLTSDTPADLRSLCLALEEIAAVDVSFAATVHVQAMSVALLSRLATDRTDLRTEVLPAAASGDAFIAFGLNESPGGSDSRGMKTRAVRDGSDWILSGRKDFISNSGTTLSRYVIIVAITGESVDGRAEFSMFLVPFDAAGLTVGDGYDKLGWRSADTHPIHLDSVRVPDSALLGRPGEGLRTALALVAQARIAMAAIGTGVTRGCLRHAMELTSTLEAFGRPLAEFQNTGFRLADLAAHASVGRLLTYDGAWKSDRGLPIQREAATAKLVTSEAANDAAAIATQLGGAQGVVGGGVAARAHQDARMLTIVEGTSEIQRLLIARSLGF
jgi:short/branched chain acyl-CoA dehydrogenase